MAKGLGITRRRALVVGAFFGLLVIATWGRRHGTGRPPISPPTESTGLALAPGSARAVTRPRAVITTGESAAACRSPITGTVEDAAGGPIAGATVSAGAILATSDAVGHYALCLPAADPLLVARASGYATAHKFIDARGDARTVNFRLSPASSIRGHVVLAGVPVAAGTSVTVQADPIVPIGAQETTTDARGVFEFGDLAAGVYRLTARKGTAFGRVGPVSTLVGGQVEVMIELRPGSAVFGVVLASGRPVSDAAITLGVDEIPGGVGTRSDAQGRFRLEGLPRGPARLAASHPGYATTERELRVTGAEQGPIELTLVPDGELPPVDAGAAEERHEDPDERGSHRLAGRVVDEHGQPIADVAIVAARGGIAALTLTALGAGHRGYTGNDGRFAIDGVPEGSYTAEVRHADYAPVTTTLAADREQEIRLQRGVVVDGDCVSERGERIDDCTVHLACSSPWSDRQTTGSHFRFGAVVAGAYRLTALTADGRAGAATVTVESTAQAVRLVVAGAVEVTGRVVDADSAAPMAAMVTTASATTWTDPEGRFHLSQLPRGALTLTVFSGGYPRTDRVLQLSEGRMDIGDIQMTRSPSVRRR